MVNWRAITRALTGTAMALATVSVTLHAASSVRASGGTQYDPSQLPPNVTYSNGTYSYGTTGVPRSEHVYALQGVHSNGACRFAESGTLPLGSPTLVEQETAFNPTTCESTRARWFVPSRGASPLVIGNNTAHTYSWFSDVANTTVTSLTSRVNWSYDGSCVTSGYGTYQGYGLWDGWVLVGNPSELFTPSCYNDEEDVNEHWKNDYFCKGDTTYNDYYYNRVFGNADGSMNFAWDSSKDGLCKNALTEHHQAGYGN